MLLHCCQYIACITYDYTQCPIVISPPQVPHLFSGNIAVIVLTVTLMRK